MDIGPVRLSDYTVHGVQAVTPLEIRPERRELIQAVKAVNRAELFGEDNEITFTSDNETRKPVTKIINKQTREVVRQIPPEYVLRLAQELTSR
jgi:flagellar protein FlaG